MKARILFIFILAALVNCRKPDRPETLIFRDGFAVGNDTTAPLVVSVTGEAGTDQLIVEFNEPVYTNAGGSGNLVNGDFSYQDNNATGTTGITAMFEANGADRIVVLTTNANLIAGDNGDRVIFPANSIFDAAGNALAATDRLIVLTVVPPTLVGAETMDTNRNGRIDHLKITFNKNLNDATFPNYVNTGTIGGVTTAWLVAGFTNVRIDPTIAADVDNDNIIYLTWDEAVTANTALTPDLTTTTSPALQATNGAVVNQIQSATVTETDAAPPVLIDATEKAGERDLVLAFSEPVYANNNATGNLTLGDFTYTNSNPGGATAFSAITDADGSNSNITIQMDTLYVLGDGNTDRISVNNNEVYDANGLVAVNCQTGTGCNGTYVTTRITNGDAPTLQTAETMDIDGNGKIDHYKLTFDVPVNDSTFPGYVSANGLGTVTTAWVIGTRTNLRIDTRDALPPTGPGDTVANDNVIYLAFDESAAACSGNDISGCDSGATPNLSTTASPGLTDLDPTTIAQIVSFTATDKAAPKLITLKGHGNATSLVAYFSEAVFTNTGGSGNLTAADFTYQNDNAGGATAIAGLSEANGADGKVTLTTTGSFALADDNTDDLIAATNAIYDAGDNALVASAAVRVVPLLLSAETMDINSDGVIDHYKLTFSIAVMDNSFPGYAANSLGSITTHWLVAGGGSVRMDTRTAAAPAGVSDVANDATVYIAFNSSLPTDGIPDLTTTVTPGLTLSSGTTMNQLAVGDIIEQDKAPPVITKALAPTGTTSLILSFSERVYTNPGTGDTFALSDFTYGNISGSGATSIVGLSEADGSDARITLTLNSAFTNSDHEADTIAASAGQIFDAASIASVSSRAIIGSPRMVADGKINTMIENAGVLYIGGTFTQIGNATGAGVLVNDSDAQITTEFTDRVHGRINVAVPDGAGGFFIGGDFQRIGDATRNYIARINADGSLHPWNPGTNDRVHALVLSGSNLYVGGEFSTVAGANRNRIAAIDVTTGAAISWNPDANAIVYALVASGTLVYAGGNFTTIGGQTRNHIAALDTTTGNATTWHPNSDGQVIAIALEGSTLYVGGSFSTIGGQSRNNIAALDTTTGNSTAWNPNASASINSIATNGSTIYVGGNFLTISGQTRNRLAAIEAATGNATSWNPEAYAPIQRIVINGSSVLVGGDFTYIAGASRNRIAAFDAVTGNLLAWHPNAGGVVNAIAISGSTIYLGGQFGVVGGQTRNRLAALETNTGKITSWNPNASGTILSMAAQGSTIYVVGLFGVIGGQNRTYKAAVDMTTGNVTAWNPPNANNGIEAIVVDPTTAYIGGNFTSIGGTTRNRLAAYDLATGSLTAWDPNASNSVRRLAISGTTVYAGGAFTFVGGQSRSYLAGIDTGTGLATSFNCHLSALGTPEVDALVVDGTILYVGGDFSSACSTPRPDIVAIDLGTGTPTSWNPMATGEVHAIAVSGGTVYAVGGFSSIGGQVRNRIAALDVTSGSATAWNPNAGGNVTSVAVAGTSIYVGGDFTAIGGIGMSHIAAIDATTGNVIEY